MIRVLSSQSMEVKWKEPPKNTINGQLRGHRVYYYSTKNPKQVFDRTVTRPNGLNGQWNVTLTRLHKFTTYKIQVAAFTRIGTGIKSLPRTGTTLEDSKFDERIIYFFSYLFGCLEPRLRKEMLRGTVFITDEHHINNKSYKSLIAR